MATNDAMELVFARNIFYRRMHFMVLGAFALSLVLIAILTVTFFYIKNYPYHPYYFAADNKSRLLQIIPVNTPNMTMDDAVKWTTKAVEAAFTYDYVNFHEQLQNAQKYFTSYGWTQYMNALTASNNLVGVEQRKLIGSATVIPPVKVVNSGILQGAWAWAFQMPVLITYTKPDNTAFSNAYVVSVIVQRQPVLEGEGTTGLGIVQLVATEATMPGNNNAPQQISNTPGG
jgi:intracellular multiplication protein IcmL